jgi:hypothetical protein
MAILGNRRVSLAALCVLFLVAPLPALGQDPEAAPAELGEAPVASVGPFRYRPGRGLRVGDTGLVIGGFTNLKAEHTDESGGEFTLDLLNVFLIFDYFTRFRAVVDLQMKDIVSVDNEHAGTRDFAFDVRRFFGEYTIADELRVRGGTFLTPVGAWNLILAPPLTWTTEAPLIIEETFFEQTTTGVMLHGSRGLGPGQLGYALFTQFLDPLEDDPELEPPDNTGGLQITYETLPDWTLGVSYQAADTNGEWSHLGGAHARLQSQRTELLAEALIQDGEDLEELQWGAYLQAVLELHRPFYAVGRFEHYDPPEGSTVNTFTVGGVWKPYPFMALKVEYRISDHRLDDEDLDGFFASFTTLF